MDLGKFLTFAKTAGILHSREKAYSEAKLEKKVFVASFKRHAQGQREINYNTFQTIMEEVRQHDQDVFRRMGMGEEGSKGHRQLLDKLKYYNLPFNTRDQQGR